MRFDGDSTEISSLKDKVHHGADFGGRGVDERRRTIYDIRRPQPRCRSVADRGTPGGGDERPGADHWRERLRQGTDRIVYPRLEPAASAAIRCGQLRRGF